MYLPEEYSRLICAPCTPIAIRSSLRFFFSFFFFNGIRVPRHCALEPINEWTRKIR